MKFSSTTFRLLGFTGLIGLMAGTMALSNAPLQAGLFDWFFPSSPDFEGECETVTLECERCADANAQHGARANVEDLCIPASADVEVCEGDPEPSCEEEGFLDPDDNACAMQCGDIVNDTCAVHEDGYLTTPRGLREWKDEECYYGDCGNWEQQEDERGHRVGRCKMYEGGLKYNIDCPNTHNWSSDCGQAFVCYAWDVYWDNNGEDVEETINADGFYDTMDACCCANPKADGCEEYRECYCGDGVIDEPDETCERWDATAHSGLEQSPILTATLLAQGQGGQDDPIRKFTLECRGIGIEGADACTFCGDTNIDAPLEECDKGPLNGYDGCRERSCTFCAEEGEECGQILADGTRLGCCPFYYDVDEDVNRREEDICPIGPRSDPPEPVEKGAQLFCMNSSPGGSGVCGVPCGELARYWHCAFGCDFPGVDIDARDCREAVTDPSDPGSDCDCGVTVEAWTEVCVNDADDDDGGGGSLNLGGGIGGGDSSDASSADNSSDDSSAPPSSDSSDSSESSDSSNSSESDSSSSIPSSGASSSQLSSGASDSSGDSSDLSSGASDDSSDSSDSSASSDSSSSTTSSSSSSSSSSCSSSSSSSSSSSTSSQDNDDDGDDGDEDGSDDDSDGDDEGDDDDDDDDGNSSASFGSLSSGSSVDNDDDGDDGDEDSSDDDSDGDDGDDDDEEEQEEGVCCEDGIFCNPFGLCEDPFDSIDACLDVCGIALSSSSSIDSDDDDSDGDDGDDDDDASGVCCVDGLFCDPFGGCDDPFEDIDACLLSCGIAFSSDSSIDSDDDDQDDIDDDDFSSSSSISFSLSSSNVSIDSDDGDDGDDDDSTGSSSSSSSFDFSFSFSVDIDDDGNEEDDDDSGTSSSSSSIIIAFSSEFSIDNDEDDQSDDDDNALSSSSSIDFSIQSSNLSLKLQSSIASFGIESSEFTDDDDDKKDGEDDDGDGNNDDGIPRNKSREKNRTLVASAAVCGNGALDIGEECDDGNARDSDGCNSTCLLEIGICGDGIIQSLLGEQCESALHDTRLPYQCIRCHFLSQTCGDGNLDPGEECDEGPLNSTSPDAACRPNCSLSRCGDEILDSVEACDDGNRVNGDGCDRYCRDEHTLVAGDEKEEVTSDSFQQTGVDNRQLQLGFPQWPTYQPVSYQLPLAQLRPFTQQQGPVGDTGPAAVAVIGAGAAAGLGWVRRKRK